MMQRLGRRADSGAVSTRCGHERSNVSTASSVRSRSHKRTVSLHASMGRREKIGQNSQGILEVHPMHILAEWLSVRLCFQSKLELVAAKSLIHNAHVMSTSNRYVSCAHHYRSCSCLCTRKAQKLYVLKEKRCYQFEHGGLKARPSTCTVGQAKCDLQVGGDNDATDSLNLWHLSNGHSKKTNLEEIKQRLQVCAWRSLVLFEPFSWFLWPVRFGTNPLPLAHSHCGH